MDPKKPGSLVFVGTGIQLAGQITAIGKSHIEHADKVFGVLPDGFADRWITQLNASFESLQGLYAPGKSRRETYREMVDKILASVRQGNNVCCALYGHPGVFAFISNEAIRIAREEGFEAHMEPGISAEDCLYADLGIDPGQSGCQQLEASQFMFYQKPLDPSALVILWQIGIAGEHTLKKLETRPEWLQALVEKLGKYYDADQEIILYEAPFLPISKPRIDRLALNDLPSADLSSITTMVIPAVGDWIIDDDMLAKLGIPKREFRCC